MQLHTCSADSECTPKIAQTVPYSCKKPILQCSAEYVDLKDDAARTHTLQTLIKYAAQTA